METESAKYAVPTATAMWSILPTKTSVSNEVSNNYTRTSTRNASSHLALSSPRGVPQKRLLGNAMDTATLGD